MEGFQYVVSKPKPAKVCFGSGCTRDVMGKPTTRHGIQYTTEKFVNVGPASYSVKADLLSQKPMSIFGIGPGARKEPRFKINYPEVPSPFKYHLKTFPEKTSPNHVAFNTGAKRLKVELNIDPGPGTYSPQDKQKHIAFLHSFGGKKRIIPHVDVKCVPENKDECSFCHRCPSGDYWHYNFTEYMCEKCMQTVRKHIPNLIPLWKVDKFRKIRDCSFFHKHEGSAAAMRLMPANKIRQIQVKETYLSQYFE